MNKPYSVHLFRIMALMLFTVTLILPLSVRSEIKAGSVEVSPFVGYNFFESSQNLKNNLIYGGRIGYNITKNIGLEGSMEFVNSKVDDKSRTGSEEGQYRSPMDSVDLMFYHIDALFHLMPESNFNPFIVAGFGGTRYSPRISNGDMSTFNFGLGAKYWVADNIALRLDLRDNMVTEVFQDSFHNLNATLGIVFAFGGNAKAKPAPAVKAKETTAPYVTLAIPYNGSTDVAVQRRLRIAFSEPMDPATINTNTITLYQGNTPIPGTVVAATSTTATFTQTNELAPGTVYTGRVTTGTRDLAGNPLARHYVWSFKTAPTPEAKVIVLDKLVMLEDTHFEFDKATLTKEGENILKQNIQILKDNPNLKVRIAGYTSASGSDKYNQELSERRADTVMAYLIKGGIAPIRLDTIGYGEKRPANYESIPSDIESKAAKSNMRVLFEVIVK